MPIATFLQPATGVNPMPDGNFSVDADLLIGAEAILKFVNSLLDEESQIRLYHAYFWIERGYVPTKRVGAKIIGSKAAIRRALTP
jgi:hypothetical protein